MIFKRFEASVMEDCSPGLADAQVSARRCTRALAGLDQCLHL
jgi:hypothetical protein